MLSAKTNNLMLSAKTNNGLALTSRLYVNVYLKKNSSCINKTCRRYLLELLYINRDLLRKNELFLRRREILITLFKLLSRHPCFPMLYNSLSFIVPYLVIISKILTNSLSLGLVLCSPTLFKSSFHHRYISYDPSYTQKRFYSSNKNTISPDNIEEKIVIEKEQDQVEEIELEQVKKQLLELPIDLDMYENANVSTDSTDSTDDKLEMEKKFTGGVGYKVFSVRNKLGNNR